MNWNGELENCTEHETYTRGDRAENEDGMSETERGFSIL